MVSQPFRLGTIEIDEGCFSLRYDESHHFLSFLPPSPSSMEFVHKAHLSDCCVKGCARHPSCSQSVHWRAPRIWPAQTKHPLRLPSRSRFACHEGSLTLTIKSMSSHIYLQSKEHHHEHASAHHEDTMEVDSHDSEQHPTTPP